jgi:dTMP kinase
MKQRGFMVAIEGIDGSGKSGVAAYLADHLRDSGYDVLRTQEPGGTEEGAMLRKLLLARDAFDWVPTAELLLMNASRRQHVERVIRPALDAGRVVVCDRFVGSTIAYQGAGRGLPDEMIFGIHRLAMDDFWPDLTLVLDLDPAVGLRRSQRRLEQTQVDEGRFETLDISFHERVRQSFLAQAASLPVPYMMIDADQSPELVQQTALEHLLVALTDTVR